MSKVVYERIKLNMKNQVGMMEEFKKSRIWNSRDILVAQYEVITTINNLIKPFIINLTIIIIGLTILFLSDFI